MDKSQKTTAFEYFLFKLDKWYREKNIGAIENDISILKALKLLFFTSAVGTTEKSHNTLLDTRFSEFYAMPYGHVESNIYEEIKKNNFKNIAIDNYSTTIKSPSFFKDIDISEYKDIDDAICKLYDINENLIKLNSFELVELSHKWYSWKYYFAQARKNGDYSVKIPIEFIKAEEKYFNLV